jgi:DNA polymerase-3 subunit gamma/tau
VFVFATTEPQKIAQSAAPVLSRLQRFDLKRIGAADIKSRLREVLDAERAEADADALAAIARVADGSMRDALSLADQVLSSGDGRVTAERVREVLGLVAEEEFLATLDLIAERRARDVFTLTTRLADAGVDFGVFLTGLADMLRAQLAVVLGGAAPDVSDRVREELEDRRDQLSAGDLLRMINAIAELEPRFRRSGQQQLLLEALLVRFALLDRTASLEDMIRGIAGGDPARRGGGSGERVDERGAARDSERGASALAAPPPTLRPPPPPPPQRAPTTDTSASGRVAVLELNTVVGRWDELLERLRAERKTILASALAHATPVALTAQGELTLQFEQADAPFRETVEARRADVLAAVREWFAGVTRVQLLREDGSPAAQPPKRLTDEMVRSERLSALRKSDPLLGAAIEALDLDVVD